MQSMRNEEFDEKVMVKEAKSVTEPKKVKMGSASLLACGVITVFGAITNTAKVAAGRHVVVIGRGGRCGSAWW